MNPAELIQIKEQGDAMPSADLRHFILDYTRGDISNEIMTGLLKAIYNNGMTPEETFALTESMLDSGERMDFSFLDNYVADKHSTGGVGDKVSLILGPLMAAAGLAIPMISGRSLGHTGGTLDKLETIPGYTVDISLDEFKRNVHDIGISMIGQTAEICPADKKMYALRDVTGTVASIPLICGSIMSKKIAEGIQGLVIDVKIGNGAFMKTLAEGQELATLLQQIGENFHVSTDIVFSSMDQPLGRYAGLWCEVTEAINCLQSEGPEDTMAITFELGSRLLLQAKTASDKSAAMIMQRELIESGLALDKFLEMVSAHGGNHADIASFQTLHLPAEETVLSAQHSGTISTMNTKLIGLANSELGCGRKELADVLDPTAGMEFYHKIGDQVTEGEPLIRLFNSNSEKLQAALTMLRASVVIDEEHVDHQLFPVADYKN